MNMDKETEGRRVKPAISVTWGTRVDEVLAL